MRLRRPAAAAVWRRWRSRRRGLEPRSPRRRPPTRPGGGVLRLRQRYLQVETVLDFYGDAVATRTNPQLAAVLRGLDTLAADSLDVVAAPAGHRGPAGAGLPRQGPRRVDPPGRRAPVGPGERVAGRRHQADPPQPDHPTALLHEIGHQVVHLAAGTTSWPPPSTRRCAAGRASWPTCGGAGRARWRRTSTPSSRRAGRRCPPWPTWSTAPRPPSIG